jgi:hypothetical protein
MLIPPSKEDALLPYDNIINNTKFSYENSNQNKIKDSYYLDNSGTVNWTSKPVDTSSFRELEKIDTKSIPNNLFELKQKELEEKKKQHGYTYGEVDSSRFASVCSDPNFEPIPFQNGNNEDGGMVSTFGKVVGEAFYKTKDLMSEYSVGSKLVYTGEKTLGAIKYTGSAIASIAQSDTTKSVLSKTGENIGYLFNRLWYGAPKEESNSNTNDNENTGNSKFIDDNDSYSKTSFSKYSPPRINDDLKGNIYMKKDNSRYSSKSYMG